MFDKLPGSVQYVLINDAVFDFEQFETFLSYPKYQFLTKVTVVLNFKEALLLWVTQNILYPTIPKLLVLSCTL